MTGQSVTVRQSTDNKISCKYFRHYFLWFGHEPSWTRYLGLSVSTQISTQALCLNDQAHIAWFTLEVTQGQLGGISGAAWRRKTTFDGRRPLTEDDFWRKTTLDGRRPLTEDDLRWKTILDRRRPLMEDNLRCKTTFDRVYITWKKILMTPHLDSHNTTDPELEIVSAV